MKNILLIALGGSLGAVLRYLVASGTQALSGSHVFPWGTAAVNVLGCLVIGFLGGWSDVFQALGSQVRLFVFIGILGGFTTFSTFGYETLMLLKDGEMLLGLANVALQVVLSLAAVWLGYTVATLM